MAPVDRISSLSCCILDTSSHGEDQVRYSDNNRKNLVYLSMLPVVSTPSETQLPKPLNPTAIPPTSLSEVGRMTVGLRLPPPRRPTTPNFFLGVLHLGVLRPEVREPSLG